MNRELVLHLYSPKDAGVVDVQEHRVRKWITRKVWSYLWTFVQMISVYTDESMKAFQAVNDKFLPGSVCSCGA